MPGLTSRLAIALPQGTSGRDAAINAGPADIRLVAERLLCQDWFLEDITGLDVAEGLALLYHFAHWERPGRVVVRVMLSHDAPECPTIEGIYPGAAWHERETRDFFGVVFTGARNETPLLLHEHLDPPPLRKAPLARVSTHQLWPHGEWVGAAKGHDLAEELMSVCGSEKPAGEEAS
jgi:NADH-quinone oxidoreductase subunit C